MTVMTDFVKSAGVIYPEVLENEISVRESLRRSYEEVGYHLRPEPESFGNGGTLTGPVDVLLDEFSGKAFSSVAGPYPLTVAKGTNPVAGGFVDNSGELLRTEVGESQSSAFGVVPAKKTTHSLGQTLVEGSSVVVSEVNKAPAIWVPKTVPYVETGAPTPADYERLFPENVVDLKHMGVSPSKSDAANGQIIEDAIAEFGDNRIYSLGGWEQIGFGAIEINNRNIALVFGGLIVDSQILLRDRDYTNPAAPTGRLEQFVTLRGLKFIKDTSSFTAPVQLQNTRRNWLRDNWCEGYQHFYHVIKNMEPSAFGQHVARCNLSGNKYKNISTFFKVENSLDNPTTSIAFAAADMFISDNEGLSKYRHIDADTIDGLTMHDNIWFCEASTQASTTKDDIAYIKSGVHLQLHDDKYFESGKASIRLDSCYDFNIHDNQHVFGGQRVESHAIVVQGTPPAAYLTESKIHDETVIEQSGGGVLIGAKQGSIKINDNEFFQPGRNTRYYGTLALTNNYIGVDMVSTDVKSVSTSGNIARRGSHRLNSGVNFSCTHVENVVDTLGDSTSVVRASKDRVLTIDASFSGSVIDVSRYEVIHVASGATATVATFANTGETKNISIVAYAAGLTLVHGSQLVLRPAANYSMVANDTISFRVESGGTARQISRAG